MFANENNGTWTMADYGVSILGGYPDLVFIKTANTQSGKTEVHIASHISEYQSSIFAKPTAFGCEANGTWVMTNNGNILPGFPSATPDLVYIKTRNTGSGKVEVHIASGSSGYQTMILHTATAFDCRTNTDGVWTMINNKVNLSSDLAFIKTGNTPSGKVEVQIASGSSGYQTIILHTTTFDCEQNGVWTMADWDRDGIPDLVFIKTSNTPSDLVEVHIASGVSNYQTRILECKTTFSNERNGTWLMRDFNRNGIQDLIFIKTANTFSNHVTVHVASGVR
jgi:hypothetical protein